MLKIADPDDDEAHGAEMLEYYGGNGAIRVIAYEREMQILEWVEAALTQNLEHMALNGADDAATEIICSVIACLQATQNATPPHLLTFSSRSATLRRMVMEDQIQENDRAIFAAACEAANGIIADQAAYMPLHGDIHHGNILFSNTRGWLAIDPKGILGPRAYEYANTLCNPVPHTRLVANMARMERQAAIMCEKAGLDKEELMRLTFLHAVQCRAWSDYAPDQAYWSACARTAAQLAGIKNI